jgi:hypothetical protein
VKQSAGSLCNNNGCKKKKRNKLKGKAKMAIYLQVDYKTGDLYEYSKKKALWKALIQWEQFPIEES